MITKEDVGLTTDQWNALDALVEDSVLGVTLYQWEASFETQGSPGSSGVSFGSAVWDEALYRITESTAQFWDADNNVWNSVAGYTSVGSPIGNRPLSVVADESSLVVFVQTSSGISRNVYTGSWSGWTQVVSDGTVYFMSAAAPDSLHFIVYDSATHNFTFKVWDGSVTSSDVVWGYPISSFAAQRLNGVDILAISSPLPGVLSTKVIENQPVKYVIEAQGICVFTYKYGSWSDHRVIDLVDQASAWRYRNHVRLSSFNDALWMVAYSSEGSEATPLTGYRLYSSKDGIHWSRGELFPLDQSTTLGVELQQVGTGLYAVAYDDIGRSISTLRYGNPDIAGVLDLSPYVGSFSLNRQGLQQVALTIDNEDDWAAGTILDGSHTLALIVKTGYWDSTEDLLIPIGLFEVDTLDRSRELPVRSIDVQGRDHLAWMTGKSQSEQFVDWEPQVVGADVFADSTGTGYGGMTHTATQDGSWKTAGDHLLLASNNEQGTTFSTFLFDTWNGAHHAGFSIATLDNDENAGLVFRAQDKDNLFSYRYDNASDTLVLRQMVDGVSVVLWESGAMSWSDLDEHYLRVEFRYSRIKLYSGDASLFWTLEQSLLVDGQQETPLLQAGYVGTTGKGFSDLEVWQPEPFPGVIINRGVPPVPPQLVAVVDPVAEFAWSVDELDVDFTDASTPGTGVIDSWDWDFGDSNTSTSQNPTHSYAAPGTYPVTLTIGADDGGSDSVTHDVQVARVNTQFAFSDRQAIFHGNGKLSITTNFNGVTTYTIYQLVVSDPVLIIGKAVPDYTSPFYHGGGALNGWFTGNDDVTLVSKIFRIDDIYGAHTVTEEFAASNYGELLKDIITTPGYPGAVALGTGHNNLTSPSRSIDVYLTHTTDGLGSWTENEITPNTNSAAHLDSNTPTSLFRNPYNGNIYTAYSWIYPETGNIDAGIHVSTDGGVTFGDIPLYTNTEVSPTYQQVQSDIFVVAVPFNSPTDIYHGGIHGSNSTAYTRAIYKNGVDISPYVSGVRNGPGSPTGLFISPHVSGLIVFVGTVKSGTNRGCFRSTDGGASWTLLGNSVNTSYIGCLIADDDPTKTLWYGSTLAISIGNGALAPKASPNAGFGITIRGVISG